MSASPVSRRSPVRASARRVFSTASLVALVLAAAFSAGCTGRDAPTAAMGMGGGGSTAAASTSAESTAFVMGAGVLAAPTNARIDLGTQAALGSTAGGIRIARVVAPVDGWLVARSATAPGAVLGKASVKRGESTDIVIPVEFLDSARVRIALHADRGTHGTFEFDPIARQAGTDMPVFADGVRVERALTLAQFGEPVASGAALVRTESQKVMDNALSVSYLLVPGPSWIAVNRVNTNGTLGARIGLIGRAAGEGMLVLVPLTGKVAEGDQLAVTAYADRGVRDAFEFSAGNPTGSADQPYVSDGAMVSQRITVR